MGRKGNTPEMGKAAARGSASTRQLIGITNITGHSLMTPHGELVYFLIQPTNISVLSAESVYARIYATMTVLKGIADLEFLCLSSRENFEGNKLYLKKRMEVEQVPAIRKLLEQDAGHLDRIQIQMATSREFLLCVRVKDMAERELFSYLARVESSLKEQGFISRRAEESDFKRILGVYYEQNVTTEKFEDTDGERWVIFND